MLSFFKHAFKKIYAQVTDQLTTLFSGDSVDSATLEKLYAILIAADVGASTTQALLDRITKDYQKGLITKGSDLKNTLGNILVELASIQPPALSADVYLIVGINGSGKTTFAAKLAYEHKMNGKKPLLVAADTFRAAATEQLEALAARIPTDVVKARPGQQEPAAVVFAACEQLQQETHYPLIIDTAGRLQTKTHLMQELAKIKRVIAKQLPQSKVCTLLSIDAMLGQNSFEQAKLFNECITLDGIVLTKIDGTGKGGIVFRIIQELGIPIAYLSYGEQLTDLKQFNAQQYVHNLLQ